VKFSNNITGDNHMLNLDYAIFFFLYGILLIGSRIFNPKRRKRKKNNKKLPASVKSEA